MRECPLWVKQTSEYKSTYQARVHLVFFSQAYALTPSTLKSCSYRLEMYLIEEHVPFHMVKTVFEYSF